MDRSMGFELPKGTLPMVDKIEPGLGLIYKAPQMDLRILRTVIETLNTGLEKAGAYPSFIEYDLSGNLDAAMERIVRFRNEALACNRLFLMLSPYFAPRRTTFQDEFKHIFQLITTLNSTLLVPIKINGNFVGQPAAVAPREVHSIVLPPKTEPKRKKLTIELEEGITEEEAIAGFKLMFSQHAEHERQRRATPLWWVSAGGVTTRLPDLNQATIDEFQDAVITGATASMAASSFGQLTQLDPDIAAAKQARENEPTKVYSTIDGVKTGFEYVMDPREDYHAFSVRVINNYFCVQRES